MIDQLEADNVDAILASSQWGSLGQITPGVHTGSDVCVEAVLEATDGAVNEAPTSVYVAHEEWAEENRGDIEKWREALTKASVWIDENDAEARAIVVEKSGADQELVDLMTLPAWSTELTPQDFDAPLEIGHEMGLLDDREDLAVSDFLLE